VSDENRFDAANKATMQCALAAMMATGHRSSTSDADPEPAADAGRAE
jgi:hypothetical protein